MSYKELLQTIVEGLKRNSCEEHNIGATIEVVGNDVSITDVCCDSFLAVLQAEFENLHNAAIDRLAGSSERI